MVGYNSYNKTKNSIYYQVQFDNTIKGPAIFVPVFKGTSLDITLSFSDPCDVDYNSNKRYTFFGKEIENRLEYAYGKSFKERFYKITWLPKENGKPITIYVTPI